MKIVKGDTVYLLSGKDVASGNRRGKVLRVYPDDKRVLVEGLNKVTKHLRPKATGGAGQVQQGGRIQMEAPLPACRVMLVCPTCDKPTRIAVKMREDKRQTLNGEKTVLVRDRYCKKCGNEMPRPTDKSGVL